MNNSSLVAQCYRLSSLSNIGFCRVAVWNDIARTTMSALKIESDMSRNDDDVSVPPPFELEPPASGLSLAIGPFCMHRSVAVKEATPL
jgi:hypothetical protein